ncbi:hypothetical protein BZG02_14425 [Labilibaculum filiforme]|uniref:CHAD domain-containing protein n=1 Tax=Labilibaculum filiforme TaxID=1940526 RepID=A0A2N3HUU2_9BACT|nr:CHAD domain-containing protein [Labilibaculum filiforme]PKQ61819.1 hypothetical protein BZG02_14425 [Labilibaculum filiforme]
MPTTEENTSLSLFYKERFDSFLIYLSEAKQIKEEDIHKLRVSIKYLRSLLLLVDELKLNTDVGSKLLKQLKGIFKSAGKLRAFQVSKSLMLGGDVVLSSEILSLLDAKLSAQAEDFRKKLAAFDTLKFKKRVARLYPLLNQVNVSELTIKVDSIIHDELGIVNKLFNSSRGEEYHHEIRKILKLVKALQYVLLAFQDEENRRQALDIVNSTETLLGNWHNYKSLDDLLILFDQELTQPTVKRTIRNLKNQNNRLKQEFKSESDKLLRNHF